MFFNLLEVEDLFHGGVLNPSKSPHESICSYEKCENEVLDIENQAKNFVDQLD